MFSLGHFVWLGVFAVLIALLLIFIKRFAIPGTCVQKTVFYLIVVFKLFHLSLSMKPSPDGGLVIDQTQLSFHLCSLMVYAVIISNFIKNERILAKLKSFMVPCMMIGAAMALLIPTEGVDPAVPRVWQYMLIHATLVFYGLYLALIERADLSLRAFVNNLKLLACAVIAAFLMNSVLMEYETNFLFLRKPPMEGLPILNMNHGWYVYFLTLAAIACLLLFLVHLPFVLRDAKARRETRKTA
ncbi:MAG: YwaF family protein [Clostridia bacterium]|nr:YwaF family protein [Clostridia bacterium]